MTKREYSRQLKDSLRGADGRRGRGNSPRKHQNRLQNDQGKHSARRKGRQGKPCGEVAADRISSRFLLGKFAPRGDFYAEKFRFCLDL